MRFGVVGATGLVGLEMASVLEERLHPPAGSFLAFASGASGGRTVRFMGSEVEVVPWDPGLVMPGDFLLGATSAEVASGWVPESLERGAVVVDNSSRFRMTEGVPLVVPEVNPGAVTRGCRLVANPNCSTIQLVVAVNPLLELAGIEWISVATYQSVSGGGTPALRELESQERGESRLPRNDWFHGNVITEIGELDGNGFCEEETKLVNETCKILGRRFPVYPSSARVPVRVGHLEAVTVRLDRAVPVRLVEEALGRAPGVRLEERGVRPSEVGGTSEVWVGRVRIGPVDPFTVQMWVTSDNVRKGAALNAVQILEMLVP